MRDKKFYEKYLPKGSKVEFQIGLQGAIIVNGMLAGKVDIGYVGDMPGIVSTSHADVRDIRIVSVVGFGSDQCNNFLVRTDAPQFSSPEDAIKWLGGKTVAVPKGSCTDRFAQAVFKRFNVQPSEYLNQSIEVITSGFRAKKLDAAVIWEPTTSRLIQEGLARKVATGVSVNENDAAFLVMPQALIEQRPDIVKGWLQAEPVVVLDRRSADVDRVSRAVEIEPAELGLQPALDDVGALLDQCLRHDEEGGVVLVDRDARRHLARQTFLDEPRRRRLPDDGGIELLGAEAAGDDLDALVQVLGGLDLEAFEDGLGEAVRAAALGHRDGLAAEPFDGVLGAA